jgi:hypothetical protein
VDGHDAVAFLAQRFVDLAEVAGAGRAGRRQLLRGLQLLEELVVGQVDAVAKALGAEEDLERDDLDAVFLPPGRREIGCRIGNDAELWRRPATRR